MSYIVEDSRTQLLQKSKKADNYVPSNQKLGKNRYERRLHSKVAKSVKQYNSMDMNKLFKDNILDVNVEVNGETDNYIVRMSFGGFLDYLHDQIERNNGQLDLRTISRALVSSFNSDNTYIWCSCDDWKYRMAYWATVKDINSGQPEDRPSNITNPNDTKGAGCKHTLLVLSNNTWLIKVASVVHNYINYMEKHEQRLYADIIYPAIYQKEYTDEVQLDMSSDDELITDTDTLDISNKYATTKSQFQKGTEIGKDTRFKSLDQPDTKQVSFDDLISD